MLSDAKIGYFIGHVFVEALAYADDIALLASTGGAMRKLLSLCDEFGSAFNVLFNAQKSNVCISGSRKIISLIPVSSQCLISV